jgi:hypothetical protein
VNNWQLVGDRPRPDLTALSYARELTERFSITAGDVVHRPLDGRLDRPAPEAPDRLRRGADRFVVGAGQGGPARVEPELGLLGRAARPVLQPAGAAPVARYNYRGKPSAGVFSEVFGNLIRGDKHNVINQLRIIYSPVPEGLPHSPTCASTPGPTPSSATPTSRPSKYPGDHFSLHTHPREVYEPIRDFLAKHGQQFSQPGTRAVR